MNFVRTSIASFAGGLFGLFLYVGLLTFFGSGLRLEHSAYAVTVGAVTGILSLKKLPWSVHIAGLSGMVLGLFLTLMLARYVWPEMPHEHILSYFLIAGLAGMVCAGLVVYIAHKLRSSQQM